MVGAGRGPVAAALLCAVFLLLPGAAAADYASSLSGEVATMTGDAEGDVLVVTVEGGLLSHNRATAGDSGFADGTDWNSALAGPQTLAAGAGATVEVDAGEGDDTVQAGSAAAPASAGAAQLIVAGDDLEIVWNASADSTGRTVSFEGEGGDPTITSAGGLSTSWSPEDVDAITVSLGNGADAIAVTGSTMEATSAIDGGEGADAFSVGTRLGPDTLGDFHGETDLTGAGGFDTLLFDADGDAADGSYELGTISLIRNGSTAAIGYHDFETLGLRLGLGSDTLVTGPVQAFTLDGGPGNDVLQGGAGPDLIEAGEGDDRIDSQDERPDIVSCGPGTDAAFGDRFDTFSADCTDSMRTVEVLQPPPTRPLLGNLVVQPSSFRSLRSGGSVVGRGAPASVRFSLTALGVVRFAVERLPAAKQPCGKGKRPSGCHSIRMRGGFQVAGVSGANLFGFSGRIGGRSLSPGRYRLLATPLGSDGTAGATARRAFRVLPPPARGPKRP